jgi:hypothetical protein
MPPASTELEVTLEVLEHFELRNENPDPQSPVDRLLTEARTCGEGGWKEEGGGEEQWEWER